MGKRFKGNHSRVTVAVAADANAPQLVEAAAGFCRRTGMKMRLVQVAEYWVGRSWPREMTLEGPLGEAIGVVEDESVRLAQSHLRRLAEGVGRGIEVETNVLTGYPGECIIADAIASQSSFIITGASKGNHRFVPRGLSTALTLMSDSPVPVMVIQAGTTPRFDGDGFRMMVADDLTDHSEKAVVAAFDLASALGNVRLHHLHINGLTEQNLTAALEAAAAASHSGTIRGVSASEVFRLAVRTIEGKMGARAPGRRSVLEAHRGIYSSEVRSGDVVDELHAAAGAFHADLLVFGRHRAFRRKPFVIGQVPFYAMLSPERPVVVVPGE